MHCEISKERQKNHNLQEIHTFLQSLKFDWHYIKLGIEGNIAIIKQFYRAFEAHTVPMHF